LQYASVGYNQFPKIGSSDQINLMEDFMSEGKSKGKKKK